MCGNSNSGWFTLLIALIVVFFILNRSGDECGTNDGSSGSFINQCGCGCSR